MSVFRIFPNFVHMKAPFLACLLTAALTIPAAGYNDYRGHDLDSLERAVARWTPDAVDRASEQELLNLNRAYRDLMMGYSTINGPKCDFYARKALEISRTHGWEEANADACRYLGQNFWGQEQYDSALVYFWAALDAVDRMAGGAVSPTNPDGYDQLAVDDTRSALYGAIGNLYNMLDSIPQAMAYYEKAGEIFEQYGWNASNAVLYYNIGETWMEQGEPKKAREAYGKALSFGREADDSLLVAHAQKGLGRVYIERGRPGKALRYLRAADKYYAAHEREEMTMRKETYEFITAAQQKQQHRLGLLCGVATGVLAIGLGAWITLRRSRKQEGPAPADKTPAATAPELSSREREILDLLAKGYTTQQIAEALSLSAETIKWYRRKLLDKFDVANVAELISSAKESGLV